MSRLIKLIWDFKGPAATKTAAHYAQHLKEYRLAEALPDYPVGAITISEMHSISTMVIEENRLEEVRNALSPHRGEYVKP